MSDSRPCIAIVDPAIFKMSGHMIDQAVSLADAFSKSGFPVTVHVHKRFGSGTDLDRFTVKRIFENSQYEVVSSDPVLGLAARVDFLSDAIARRIASIVQSQPDVPTFYIFPTVNVTILFAIAKFLRRHPHLLAQKSAHFDLLCYLECGVSLKDSQSFAVNDSLLAYLWRSSHDFIIRQSDASHIQISAVTAHLGDVYSKLFGFQIPHIETYHGGGDADVDGGGPREHVVLYAGVANLNKGYALTPALISTLCKRFPNRQFLVHATHSDYSSVQPVTEKIRLLATTHRNFRFIDAYLSRAEFHSLIAKSQLNVLAYRKAHYVAKTSGLLWDCIFHGCPIVVPSGTWLSCEADRHAAASVQSAEDDAASVVEAAISALERLDALADLAGKARDRFRAATGPRAFVERFARQRKLVA